MLQEYTKCYSLYKTCKIIGYVVNYILWTEEKKMVAHDQIRAEK